MNMIKDYPAGRFAAGNTGWMWVALGAFSLLPSVVVLLLSSPPSDPLAGVTICTTTPADTPAAALQDQGGDADRAFMAENKIVMNRMMAAMAISPTGDADRSFVAMMVAHHQGAIDMAIAELRHGRNEQARRIAQEIVVTQGQEIRAMRNAILPASSPDARPDRTAAAGRATAASDSKDLLATITIKEIR